MNFSDKKNALAGALLAVFMTSAGATDSAPSLFLPTVPHRTMPRDPAPAGMVWIPGGEFSMGGEGAPTTMCGLADGMRDAQPVHRVDVDGFWMDRTDVTNAQFAKFVQATGYVTVAEKAPSPADFPGVPVSELVPGALVFTPTSHPVPLDNVLNWWRYQKGADWRHPEGPASTIAGRENYPVVQVAYDDAVAYAKWAGKRLPTEAEWEFAARGGLAGKPYVWGDQMQVNGKWMANTWQGTFPVHDTGEDGYLGLAPVAKFPANGYGLYDMAGNVWQWCSDWYRADYYSQLAAQGGVARNPQGPKAGLDPVDLDTPKRVERGGSFLCTASYCSGYLVSTRNKDEPSSAANHVGFRCVR
jgi:formylglycine-generating enzyme